MQLDFLRRLFRIPPPEEPPRLPPPPLPAPLPEALDPNPLQTRARDLLLRLGRHALADKIAVRWNPRMRSTAGLAYPGRSLITLNPRLRAFGEAEVDRTLLHELAHLLAHDRAGRRRIAPHGPEWRRACRDLGLDSEPRCHDLPLPRRQVARKHTYRCPACHQLLHRVRPLRKKAACLACCRAHSGGRYDERFSLRKVKFDAGG